MLLKLFEGESFRVSFEDNSSSSKIEKSAREVFKNRILKDGYTEVEKANHSEADIVVAKNDKKYYFEIKSTTKDVFKEAYFGSASFTEWKKAFEEADNYKFILALFKSNSFEFYEISVQDMMEASTIPPIVVFFSIGPRKKNKRTTFKNTDRSALRLSKDSFAALDKIYMEQKKKQISKGKGKK